VQRTPRILPFALVLLLTALTPLCRSSAADFSAIWDGGNGNWDDPLHWNTNPNFLNNSKAGTYDATISSGNVTIDRNITVQRLFLTNFETTLSDAYELTLNEGLSWNYGATVGYSTTINLATGSASRVVGELNGTLNSSGTMDLVALSFSGTFNNLVGATVNLIGPGVNAYNGMLTHPAAGVFNNAGNLIVSRSSSPVSSKTYLWTAFNNTGTVSVVDMADLWIDRGTSTGSFNLAAQTNMSFTGVIYTLAHGATISGVGTVTNLELFHKSCDRAGHWRTYSRHAVRLHCCQRNA
jgi:hypothetical protein